MNRARAFKKILFATSVLALGPFAGAANAQTAPAQQAQAQQPQTLEEVIVTGSRIEREGFTAPTPVTTLTASDLEARAPGNLTEIQNDIPALQPNLNTNGNRQIPGQSNANLRGLGENRTLLLLDGQRLPPTMPQGSVDISIIPTALISRIELVTGGASAAYGSDAVAGVVNVLLDNTFEGFKGTFQTGASTHGDYQNYQVSTAVGTDFGGDKGHIVAAAEWYENVGQNRTGTRDWGRDAWTILTNPAYVAGVNNGQTRLVFAKGAKYANMTDGGVITGVGPASPLYGIQFGPGGTPQPFRYGQYFATGSTFMIGGDGSDTWSENINLSAYQQRWGGLLNMTYDVSQNVEAFVNGIYSHRDGHFTVVPNYNNGDITIARDNAYLPAQIRTIMTANNITSFRMGRTNEDAFNPDSSGSAYSLTESTQNITRIGAGLRGDFGDGWSWDAIGQYGHTGFTLDIKNDRNQANWLRSIDSVIHPTTGLPVCRSTLTNPSDGCVPVNLFGPDSVSVAAGKYAFGTSETWATYERYAGAANLRGEPFTLPAGPVSAATGVEFRHDALNFDADPVSQALGWRTNNQKTSVGEYTVVEGYVETVVPIVSNTSWADSFDLNGAARLTNYSNSGTVFTWKAGLTYVPTSDWRVRGTVSRDIRAPSLYELYAGQNSNRSNVTDRFTNTTVSYLAISGGEASLVEETGTTYTAGVVYTPGWLPGLQTSLDYYHIKLVDSIGNVSAQQTIDNCFVGLTVYCSKIVRDSSGVINTIFLTALNAGDVKVKGFDFDMVYTFEALAGDVTLHALFNYVPDRVTIANGIANDAAGSLGTPHWRTNFTASYAGGGLTFQAQARWVQGGTRNSTYITGVDIDDNHVPSRLYVNLSGGYDIAEGIQVFGKVENLFDKDPPITPGTAIGNEQASAPQFDSIGRKIGIGVRVTY